MAKQLLGRPLAYVSFQGNLADRSDVSAEGGWTAGKPDCQIRTADVDQAGNVVPGLLVDIADVDFSYVAFGAGVSVIVW